MPDIHHQLIIEATAEKIYQCITSKEGLAGWWTPDATAIPEVATIARFPFGPDYFKEMNIVELLPSKLVRWQCIQGAEEWIGTTLSFQLESHNKDSLLRIHPEMTGQAQQQVNSEVTLLIFHQDNWKEYSPMYAECNYTWAQFLRSLKLLCETGKGRPWPTQHKSEN